MTVLTRRPSTINFTHPIANEALARLSVDGDAVMLTPDAIRDLKAMLLGLSGKPDLLDATLSLLSLADFLSSQPNANAAFETLISISESGMTALATGRSEDFEVATGNFADRIPVSEGPPPKGAAKLRALVPPPKRFR